MEERNSAKTITFSLETIGFITFIVFLILKLTHTWEINWFWVWFPLWLPIATFIALIIIALIIGVIFGLKDSKDSEEY